MSRHAKGTFSVTKLCVNRVRDWWRIAVNICIYEAGAVGGFIEAQTHAHIHSLYPDAGL